MEFIAVAFTIRDTNELFLETIQSSNYEDALCYALRNSGFAISTPETYQVVYAPSTTYIDFCKIACDIDNLMFCKIETQN